MPRKKTGGRQKGAENHITRVIRDRIKSITGKYFNGRQFTNDLRKLRPNERLILMERLTRLVISAPAPERNFADMTDDEVRNEISRLQREMETRSTSKRPDLSMLTDAELEEMDRITQKIESNLN